MRDWGEKHSVPYKSAILSPISLRFEVLLCLRRDGDTWFPWKAASRQEGFYTNKTGWE